MARFTRNLTTLVFAFVAGLGLLALDARAQNEPAAPAPQIRTGGSDYMYMPEIGTTVVLFGLAIFAVARSPTRS